MFAEEAEVNPAFSSALRVLEESFQDSEAAGAKDYADFLFSGLTDSYGTDVEFLRSQHRQTAAMVGRALFATGKESGA